MTTDLSLNTGTGLGSLSQARPRRSMPGWLISLTSSICETQEGGNRRYFLPARLTIDGEQKAGARKHLIEAEAELVPAIRDSADGTREALAALTNLFTVYPQMTGERDDVRQRGKIVLQVLGDLPAWAICEAVSRWLKGEAGPGNNYSFAPAPAVLRAVALGLLEPARNDATKIRTLLAAADNEPAQPVEGERERVAAGFKSLSEALGEKGAVTKRERKEQSDEFTKETNRRLFERACEGSGLDPTGDFAYSPELVRSLKPAPAAQDQPEREGV